MHASINETSNKIDNPAVLSSYPNHQSTLEEDLDFLILTTDELKDSFIPLQDAHNASGVSTIIRTLLDVGSNNQEDIREYLRTVYIDSGIDYVLLGGDSDIVPVKKLWAEVNGGGTTDHIPSDVYYACLDGPYNYDGDNRWGEPHDGEGGGPHGN